MSILVNLLGESPFWALVAHGEKVHLCVRLLREAFGALQSGDRAQLRGLAERISLAETEADKLRNQLHENLATQVLLPIRREELFNILEHQDSMADRAEDIAFLLTYRAMNLPGPLLARVMEYVEMVLTNCELARGIISRLDLLVEASFTGRDALTVSKLITELAEREDDIKPAQTGLTRDLLEAQPSLPPVEAILWMQVIGLLAKLSKHADHTGNGIRMTLKLKSSR